MTKMKPFAQGEIYVREVDTLPDGLKPFEERGKTGAFIVSHSESGHHHLLEADGVAVMERTENVPAGMRILYAIVEKPASLYQDAANPHDPHTIPPGIVEMRIAREFDPIMEQARQVAD